MTSPSPAQDAFRQHFGLPPLGRVHLPGFLSLMGRHSSPLQGLLLGFPAGPGVSAGFTPRAEGVIALAPDELSPITFRVDQLAAPGTPGPVQLIKRTLLALQGRGVHFKGFSLALQLRHPPFAAAELAQQEAVCLAVLQAVRRMYPFTLELRGAGPPPPLSASGEPPPLELAQARCWASLVETIVASVAPIAGQGSAARALALLRAQPWHASVVDGLTMDVASVPVPGYIVALCPVPSPPGHVACATVRQQAAEAARRLGAASLRRLDLSLLESRRAELPPLEYASARRLLEEIALCSAAERALREEDLSQFAYYLGASPGWFQPSPEAELVLRIATPHPACVGSCVRLGFTVHLLKHHLAPHFVEYMRQHLARELPSCPGVTLGAPVEAR